MFDDLEHYLSTLVSRERVDTTLNILTAITTLVGPESTSTFALYSLGVPTDVDPMEEIARFDDALEDLVSSALAELGITLDAEQFDSGKFPVLEQLLFALTKVEAWQDADRLLANMVATDDHQMAIAELAGEINGTDFTEFALIIDSVSNDFYNTILEVIEKNLEADIEVETSQATPLPLDRIRAHFQGRAESFVSTAIRNNTITFGMGYEFYLKFYENYLWDMVPELLANALVDFAVCSNLNDGDVCPSALKAIGHYAETIEHGQAYTQTMQAIVAKMPQQYNRPSMEAR